MTIRSEMIALRPSDPGRSKFPGVVLSVVNPVAGNPENPASILQLHPDFTLVCDEAALSLV